MTYDTVPLKAALIPIRIVVVVSGHGSAAANQFTDSGEFIREVVIGRPTDEQDELYIPFSRVVRRDNRPLSIKFGKMRHIGDPNNSWAAAQMAPDWRIEVSHLAPQADLPVAGSTSASSSTSALTDGVTNIIEI